MVEGHEFIELENERIRAGRDPRTMSEADFVALGHRKRPILDVIRENCIDCMAGNQAEVRRCAAIRCPMWPYRMGTNPFLTRELSDEAKAAGAARLRAAREARKISAVE